MDLINEDRLELQVDPAQWDVLIRRSAALLERDRVIDARYVDAVFDSIRRNGSYMVIVPRVLLAHARPEEGALGTGLSLVTPRTDAPLDGDPAMPIRMFFTLATTDSETHLDLIAHLATVLVDEQLLAELATSADTARVAQILEPT